MYKAKHIDICSGITLHYIKTDKFKTDTLTFMFSSQLDAEKTSFRSLMMNVLMSGCQKFPSIKDINDKMSQMYGADFSSINSKMGDIQNNGVTLKFLNDRYIPGDYSAFEDAVDTIYNILFRPLVKENKFDNRIFELEKKNLTDSILADINNKTVYARKKCLSLMCENELYGINVDGEISVIENIDARGLYEFYREFIVSTPMDIYYVGMQEESDVYSLIKDRFSDVRITPSEYKRIPIVYDVPAVKRVTETMKVTQGKLSLGFRTGITRKSKDYAALTVFNALFGLTPTSKLFRVVREKMSLCYYCRSQLADTKGLMLVSSGIECRNKELAEAEILNQLDEIKKGNVSEEEMKLAKKFHINALKALFDSAGAMVLWCAGEIYDNVTKERDELIGEIKQVTVDDVVRVAGLVKLDTVYYLKGESEVCG